MAYNALNNLIDAYIYANGVQAITGQILNGVLKQMVSQLGSGYHLMGVADPETVPASNDYAMAYFAATAGEYTDFGGITLAAGEVAVLLTSGNGSWSKQTIYNVPTTTEDLENTAGFITNAVTDLVNYYTKTEVDDTLADYPTLEALATALADYYTKQEIDTTLEGYPTKQDQETALGDYYTKDEMDAALGDRYTKDETDTKLADYYKKTETYDKDEVDSIVAALSRQEYIVAWDGLAAPDVSAIPAGVTVTYSGTTYTGTLAASASTVNKIYMVWNGTAYDMYGTSQDGGYSWVPMGTTTVDLSQYATKAEVSQLEAKVNGESVAIPFSFGNTLIWYATESGHQGGATATSGGYKSTDFVDVSTIESISFIIQQPTGTVAGVAFYDSNKAFISALNGFWRDRPEETIQKANFPAGTAYLRICTYYESYYESSLYANKRTTGLEGDVAALVDKVQKDEEKYGGQLEDLGINSINVQFPASSFVIGGMYHGTLVANNTRVASEKMWTFQSEVRLIAQPNFRFGIHIFVNGVFSTDPGWQVAYTIPAGTSFKIVISRTPEAAISEGDIPTFLAGVLFNGGYCIDRKSDETIRGVQELSEESIDFRFDKTLIWYETASGHQGGATATSGGYKSTDFIPVSTIGGFVFVIQQPTGTVAGIAFYDSNKTFISALNNYYRDRGEDFIDKLDFPANTAYVRFCTYYEASYESSLYLKARKYESVWDAYNGLDSRVSTLEESESVPQDKYWAACGDSITNANHGNIFDIDETDPYLPIDGYEEVSTYKRKNYAYYIAKNYRIKWANYGYGGTTLTHTAPKAYQGQVFAPFVDTRITQLKDGIDWDYITIFFGYNDSEFNPIYQRDLWLSETYGGDIGYPVQSSQIGASGFATQAQKDACDAITGYVGDIEYTDNELYFFAKFIGTLSDNTKNTWCGALNYAIPYLLNKYRKAKIVLVVPFINGTEKTRMIRSATLAIAEKFGLQVFDFGEIPYWYMTAPLNGTIFRNPDNENGYWYAESGIVFNPNIDGYNRAKYSYDGLHPSNLGYQTIAGPIGNKLING